MQAIFYPLGLGELVRATPKRVQKVLEILVLKAYVTQLRFILGCSKGEKEILSVREISQL